MTYQEAKKAMENKLATISTEQLQEVVQMLAIRYGELEDICFEFCLNELEKRMDVKAFVAFCDALEL